MPIEVELAPVAAELLPTAKEPAPAMPNGWQAALLNKLGAATLPEAHCARASVDKVPTIAAAIANAAQVFDENPKPKLHGPDIFLPPQIQPDADAPAGWGKSCGGSYESRINQKVETA
jgi:hypothetical protein